ncbi:MAG: TonB family protein [Cyanobacteriota bacterium erpe_2018_sw_39hr_WHONDRS-SW48-000098_B_bin.30]|jgi:protein TonB|nr:TonB family protein [Candidatus Obscuribacter sp.]MDQ5964315.1 TonB family protein [Cyanobacteriota bacterium erpe_2018_sw_39hr_WHONDRS-SW48-000098_B_bin.30]
MPSTKACAQLAAILALSAQLSLTPLAVQASIPAGLLPGCSNLTAGAEKVDINPYMQKISDKLSPLWSPPANAKVDMVTVVFTVQPNGSLTNVGVKAPSGDPAIDALAIATVKKAGNFGPLPKGVPSVNASFGLPCKAGASSNGVDTQPYMNTMGTKIKGTWWVPKRLLFNQVVLRIVLDKDGNLASSSVLKPSGDANADKLALIAVRRAAPFGPLPEGVKTPYTIQYTLGYQSTGKDHFVVWNGERVGKDQSYTTSGGVKTTLTDTTTEKDRQFHLRKENALIKMYEMDEAIAAETKANGADSLAIPPLLREYAIQNKIIEEHKQAEEKLKQGLAISRKVNESAPSPRSKNELTKSLLTLGEFEYSIANYTDAENLLKEGITLKESASEKDDDYKEFLNLYAKLLYKQNRAKEADEVYQKIKSWGQPG